MHPHTTPGIPTQPRARVAVILSCYNRRQKTLNAIECVLGQSAVDEASVDLFVTDDGSEDGTAEAIACRYPDIRVLHGNGTLFWNGGMRLAWQEAFKGDYDFFLWLNDDTFLYADTLHRLLDTHALCMARHGRAGIVVGSTCDDAGRTSYGGVVQGGPLRPLTMTVLDMKDEIQGCDTFTGNCVLVSRQAADVLGNLDSRFVHAMGDTDYGLRAKRAGIPMWVMPRFAGYCINDSSHSGSFTDPAVPLKIRLQKVMSPKGLPWKSWMVMCRRHAGLLWPVYWAWPYMKIVVTSGLPAVHNKTGLS
jgi:GT2 family glycosyltransferase